MSERRSLKDILASRKALFAKKPEAAVYRPTVSTQWKGGLLNENRIRTHVVMSDYPVPSGGDDKAPNPMEMMLMALGSCVGAVYVEYAAMLDIELETVNVELSGDIDLRGLFNVADVNPGFNNVSYKVRLKTSADEAKTQELIDLAGTHCPVSSTMKLATPVAAEVTVEK
ncbi:MAG: OsmC family protein [Nitrospinota bacterium]|nr:OsmC family protein [Nitrospinota bacterium]